MSNLSLFWYKNKYLKTIFRRDTAYLTYWKFKSIVSVFYKSMRPIGKPLNLRNIGYEII